MQTPTEDMEARLGAAERELRHRRDLVELAQTTRDRLVIEAIDVLGMSRADVARALGVSESAVRKALVAA
jgi:DNA-directed RNA polymerase specialized sigma24 family protein